MHRTHHRSVPQCTLLTLTLAAGATLLPASAGRTLAAASETTLGVSARVVARPLMAAPLAVAPLRLAPQDVARGRLDVRLPLDGRGPDARDRMVGGLLHIEPLDPVVSEIEIHGLGMPVRVAPHGTEVIVCPRVRTGVACARELVLRLVLAPDARPGVYGPPFRARWLPSS